MYLYVLIYHSGWAVRGAVVGNLRLSLDRRSTGNDMRSRMGSPGEAAVGLKITLGEACDGGADGLIVYCVGMPATAGGCTRTATLTMLDAIALWGADRRLDDLPLYCALCGSRAVEVRPNYVSKPDTGEVQRLMQKAYDRKL